MASSSVPFLFLFDVIINMLFLYSLLISALSPMNHPLCHSDESSALLQFKESFIVDKQASKYNPLAYSKVESIDPSAYPKVESWNLTLHNDCCSWDGVECDKITGHVIGLDLSSSCLYGSINSTSSLFNLVHLRKLNLAYNHFNFSKIPARLGSLLKLTHLNLSNSAFVDQIPSNISQLSKLSLLDLSCNDKLMLKNPNDFKSLVQNLTNLEVLQLFMVDISSTVPDILANFSSLISIRLGDCELYGEFPIGIFQLPRLQILRLGWNFNLKGQLPEFNFSSPLQSLVLSETSFSGKLPSSIGDLSFLNELRIAHCNFSGQVPASLMKAKELVYLHLSYNNLEVVNSSSFLSWIGMRTKLVFLGLSTISLNGEMPVSFSNLTQLAFLQLDECRITGKIPYWLMNMTKLRTLDLSINQLQGPIPNSIFQLKNLEWLDLLDNSLNGQISPMIRTLYFLYGLDLSNNNLSGTLPQCLGNLSTSILSMNLGSNNFHGKIPQTHTKQCNLRMLILDSNQFEGQVPRSLLNCSKLESLILGNNQINDVFPSWLGALQSLKILILRSNQFHGVLGNYVNNHDFPNLHIIDLSQNNFSGQLPAQYFLNWNAMKIADADQLIYMDIALYIKFDMYSPLISNYSYSMSIINKGIKLEYSKILESFMAIDLSSNKFEGDIPESIGNLIGVRLLNLSNNNLSGRIPSSLGSLTKLESLDLSRNHLSGGIPQQLTQLNFLAVLNVSYNHLAGPIPHGKQFDTFENNSYLNNSRLCGNPLSRKCENSEELPSSPSSRSDGHQDLGSPFEFSWKPVLMGYGGGAIIGVVIGHYVTKWKYEWFLKTFRVR